MALNFNLSSTYLHVVTDQVIAGQNKKEVQASFTPATALQFTNTFKVGNKQYNGEWVSDGGDLAAPAPTQEPRSFCVVGQATFSFTGTSIALRLSLNPGWGSASLLIDGVKPSTISGVVGAKDTVTSDATANGSNGNETRDFMIADNLPPGAHTLTITATNSNPQAFFVIVGIKVYSHLNTTANPDCWAISRANRQQPVGLTFTTMGGTVMSSASITFDSRLLDPATGTPLGTKNVTTVSGSAPYTVTCLPDFTGTEATGSNPMTVQMTYLSPDPSGTQTVSVPLTTSYKDASISYYSATSNIWSEQLTGFPEAAEQAASKNGWLTFPNYGNSFNIRVYRDSYGSAGVNRCFKSPVIITACKTTSASNVITFPAGTDMTKVVIGQEVITSLFASGTTISSVNAAGLTATASANATGTNTNLTIALGTFVTTFTVDTSDPLQAQKFANLTVAGFGSTYNGKILVRPTGSAGLVYNTIWNTTNSNYTQVTDNLTINFNMHQVLPQPVTDVFLQNGQVQFNPPDPTAYDFNANPPYDNRGIESYDIQYRFPTFLTCYVGGFLETFKQYDIVITDPGALNRSQTKALQDLGIKVYHYVSFGEEDGIRKDKWDLTSDLGPYTGDGTGPGGFAGYYMKGGYNYGEVSECSNDNQRMLGTATCAQNQTTFYKGNIGGASAHGRCSNTCTYDSRLGYVDWQAGNACAGGYTSANNWQRDATVACKNAACPKYTPVNKKCAKYAQATDVWGQDYSLYDYTHPDENGIWNSYFIDAVKRGPGSWFEKLQNYYLPLIFGTPQVITEDLTLHQYALQAAPTTKVWGIQMTHAPIDEGEPFSVKDKTTGYTYIPNLEYSYDKMTGVITMTVDTAGTSPQSVDGQILTVNYTTRALGADGVFMDTVDTVDIYPHSTYQAGFASLINDLKALYPTKAFCSNRGFTIYDQIIGSCDMIMTESVFSDYNFDTGTYQLVTNPDSVQFNNDVTVHCQQLRQKHKFDVVCLNYAPNDSSGDAIRAAVQQKVLALGWMPWVSNILLNQPLPNNTFQQTDGPVRTNSWSTAKKVIPIHKGN